MCGAKKGKFVVVIDAGHGGKDTGAAENRAVEKDINLGIALKLEQILKKKKDIKVVMTRSKDKFVALHDRVAKANKEKADLFISIHSNSLDASNPNRKTVEGASVYVLGLDSDADNLAVAQRENRVIVKEKDHEEKYEGFDPDKDESYIIFEMMQKNTLNQSIGFARSVQQELVKTAGRKDRGVRQAGFLVLRKAAMPSVLVEVDFICNPQTARYIASSSGQKKIAQAIANAVVTYRKNIEKKGDKAYADSSLDGDMQNSGDCFVLESDVSASDRTVGSTDKKTSAKRKSAVPRKRRSLSSKKASSQRNLETEYIAVKTEGKAGKVISTDSQEVSEQKGKPAPKEKTSDKVEKRKDKDKKGKENNNRKQTENANDDDENIRIYGNKKVRINTPSASNPRSLKSDKDTRSGAPVKVNDADKNRDKDGKTDVDNKDRQSKDDSETMSANDKVKAAMNAASGKNNRKSEKDKKRNNDKNKQTEQDNKKEKDSSVEENRRNYEKTIQKSAEKNKTSAAPVSLKSKKHKTNKEE